MAHVKTFRDLVAWQKGMALARVVYADTNSMPTDERYGLTSQMRRASVSIPSNIAEGFGRESRADLLRFLRHARGSLHELDTQIELAIVMGMLRENPSRHELLQETDRVLQGLIRSMAQAN